MTGQVLKVSRLVWPLVLAALLGLGGCATAMMTLSKDELQNIRVARVDVVYEKDSGIMWEKAELEYIQLAKSRQTKDEKPKPWKQVMPEDIEAKKNEYQELVNSPEGKAHIQARLRQEISTRLGNALAPKFSGGTRPVVVEVTVKAFIIPSPAQRVVLGGAPTIGAVTVLKDAQTGAVLAKMDRAAAGYAGNGVLGVLVDQAFADLEDRVLESYNRQVVDWLTAA
jgi:hypothetical protein